MKPKHSNKSFGILFFIFFSILGLWPLLNDKEPKIAFLVLAAIFLILGLINSKLLTPLNKYWIKLGELLGRIIAPIVMALVYFIILTPISLLVRAFGKDLLNIIFSRIS